MADREKVIKALEWCQENACGGCPYDTHNNKSCEISDDILTLLKEQEKKETPMTMERINVVKVDGNDFYKGFCPACKTLQYGIKSKYCDQCGQAVKWE